MDMGERGRVGLQTKGGCDGGPKPIFSLLCEGDNTASCRDREGRHFREGELGGGKIKTLLNCLSPGFEERRAQIINSFILSAQKRSLSALNGEKEVGL